MCQVRHCFVSLADHVRKTYGGCMGRVVMLVLGTLLGLFVLFNFLLPMLVGLVKIALIIGVIALLVFVAVTVVGKSSRSH